MKLALICMLLCGCSHKGYHKDRDSRMFNLYGIGWMDRNRVFGLGLMSIVDHKSQTTTNNLNLNVR